MFLGPHDTELWQVLAGFSVARGQNRGFDSFFIKGSPRLRRVVEGSPGSVFHTAQHLAER